MVMSMLLKNKNSRAKKRVIVAIVVVAVVAGIFVVLELTGITHVFKKEKPYIPPQTIGQENKGEGGDLAAPSTSSSAGVTSNNVSTQQAPTKRESTPTTITNLLTPSGTFISNHTATMATTENSVCVTSPGATCTIVFTRGAVAKTLPAQTTDNEGAAYWNGWKIGSYLSSGTWTVQAKATYNGQTKTANDALKLTVSP